MQTIEQFYSILKHIVANSPDTQTKCESIQAYVVSANEQTYSKQQLDVNYTEREKPYFYSRKWALDKYPTGNISFDYPLLAVTPGQSSHLNFFLNDSLKEKTSSMEIGVFDKYVNSGSIDYTAGPCAARNIEEIWSNCELLLEDVLSKLPSYAAYQAISGKISYLPETGPGYPDMVKLKTETIIFRSELQSLTPLQITRWQGGVNDLYGVYVQINMPINNCQ